MVYIFMEEMATFNHKNSIKKHGIGIKRINFKKYNGIIEFDPGTEIFSVLFYFLDN